MTCEEVRPRLSWYLDNELPAVEADDVRHHLGQCAACRATQDEMEACDRQIVEVLRGSKPSKDFAHRVVAAVPRPNLRWVKVAAVAAAVLVALLGIVTTYVNNLEAPPLAVAVHGGESLHADSMAALRVFVTHATNGHPVASAAVRILLAGREVGNFKTGPAGSLDGFFRVPDLKDGSYPLRVEVDSPLGKDALERTVTVRREYRLLLTTDKPMYQPGQPIQVRALALNAFTLKPRAGEAEFEVLDSRGNKIYTKKTKLSDYGIGSAELLLADEVNLGTYRVAVTASGLRQERTVEVAKYVLPKFKVDLELDKASYRPGEPMKGTVRAKYFFGKAVRGRVHAKVGREIVSGDLREDGTWEFHTSAPSVEGLAAVEVRVTDTADHRETRSTGAVVSREPLKVVLVPEGGGIVHGPENTFYLLVSTPDGRPAKADLLLWVNGGKAEVATDDLGVAKVAAASPYQIRLERARDAAGNETRQMDHRTPASSNDFLIRLDRPSYKGGETMTVKVLGRGPVYVDLVKGGQLLLAKAVEEGDLAIDLPPDLFGTIQVVAYKRGSAQPVVRLAYVNLPEGLRIRPKIAKETFRPGEEMPVEFEVVDQDGKPVAAALGIAVVDEALFGLVESKIASEKAWLSLAPELIDTRGFLKAEANEIYQAKSPNAQGFVGGNGRGAVPAVIAQNAYSTRVREVQAFIAEYNEVVAGAAKGVGIVLCIALVTILLGIPLVRGVRALATSKVSGLVVLLVVAGMFFAFLLAAGMSGGHPVGFVVLFLFGMSVIHGFLSSVWWFRRDHFVAGLAALGLTVVGIGWVLVGAGGSKPTFAVKSVSRESEADGWVGYRTWALPRKEVPRPVAAAPAPPTREEDERSYERRRAGLLHSELRPPTAPARGPEPSASPPPAVSRSESPWESKEVVGDKGERESSEPARVREYFPETLFWMPQLITDERGRARLTLPPADSITSWRMLTSAIAKNGALGFGNANLKVFQDFFIDIDFPVALTKGDRVHVPVAVYNYLKEPQTVTVRVERQDWFELLDADTKAISLKPEEVSVVYFGLRVKGHGRRSLTVFADGRVKDAVRRSVEVMEKGREMPVSASERVRGRHTFKVEIPDRAIEGASILFVRLSPGVSDLVTGLEGMVRMPYG